MFDLARTLTTDSKPELYSELASELTALVDGERDSIAHMANAAALLFHRLPRLNWAGFYRLVGEELVLGPFQGKPACIRIPVGQGVCGTAVARRASIVVPDVDAFPGHIACDSASRSELVVPLIRDGRISGVLDLDSPERGRFDEHDQRGCEQLVAILMRACDPF
ncbi:GAF domain-containing protein [Microvirga massiliensis]|uniref:GAF domain-containing protein n=1 Tax=Microvirga massiliensis TaxID=1033741 RepID=UPI00062B569D|nr:GAF domain-containing protein [Microvirga massiliensis]